MTMTDRNAAAGDDGMPSENTGFISIHVHPSRAEASLFGGEARPATPIHIHLHGKGAAGGGAAGAEPPHRPLLVAACVAMLLGTAGFVGYRMGSGHAEPPAERLALAPAVPPQTQASILRELQQPPQVTPPPGAPAEPDAKAGPGMFGLAE
jgi:hypothetical protein